MTLHDECLMHDIILNIEQPDFLFLVCVQLFQAAPILNTASLFLDSVPTRTQRSPVLLNLKQISHLLLILIIVIQVLLSALTMLGGRSLRIVSEPQT